MLLYFINLHALLDQGFYLAVYKIEKCEELIENDLSLSELQ